MGRTAKARGRRTSVNSQFELATSQRLAYAKRRLDLRISGRGDLRISGRGVFWFAGVAGAGHQSVGVTRAPNHARVRATQSQTWPSLRTNTAHRTRKPIRNSGKASRDPAINGAALAKVPAQPRRLPRSAASNTSLQETPLALLRAATIARPRIAAPTRDRAATPPAPTICSRRRPSA
jgi:hypothetical protein